MDAVPVEMRLLYYLMMKNDNLPDKDRSAAHKMLKMTLFLQQNITTDSASIHRALSWILQEVNDKDIVPKVTVLSSIKN